MMTLTPSQPIVPARRVQRRLRSEEGQVHTRVVIEPVTAAGASTPQTCYALESILVKKPKKGITLFLATPAIMTACSSCPQEDGSEDKEEMMLVSCGSSPVVVKAVPHLSNKHFAGNCCDDPLVEVAAMQHLSKHGDDAHVIRLLDCMQDKDFVYLVLPYMAGGDMFSRVEDSHSDCGDSCGLTEEDTITYFRQIVEGLLFMKRSGIAHHDLSLENIMLNHQDQAQIIDMGMCLHVPETKNNNSHNTPIPSSGKPGYIAPEVVREEGCDAFAADVWSLGICLYIMLTGRPLYSSPSDQSFKAMARGRTFDVMTAYERYGLKTSPCAKDLICRMLHAEPAKRPTLEDILDHHFFTSSARC